jgi:hypothetical protein
MSSSWDGLRSNLGTSQPASSVHCTARRVRAFDAQVATHEGLAHIDVFYLDFDFILLAVRGLSAHEATTGPKEGGRCVWYELYRHQQCSRCAMLGLHVEYNAPYAQETATTGDWRAAKLALPWKAAKPETCVAPRCHRRSRSWGWVYLCLVLLCWCLISCCGYRRAPG